METLFDPSIASRSAGEWRSLLDMLLAELASHLELPIQPTSYTTDPQEVDCSYGCNLDFRSALNARAELEICGILCITVNVNEEVFVGAYLLLYLFGRRLPLGCQESVLYVQRTIDGWQPVKGEVGETGEWSQYKTPARWHLTTGCS